MSTTTQSYKGARDFYPEDKRLQKWMFQKWSTVCERYGYEQYDAPILEPTELYLMKGSQEIVNEQTYSFTDRGGRSVTIRTEMTPSVSRMVAAKRQELSYPLRWYSVPNLWRYERMQRGRGREFWQLNVDIFGVDSLLAELEIVSIADSIFKEVGAKPTMYQIRINSRKFTESVFGDVFGLTGTQVSTLVRLIDKKNKMPASQFENSVEAVLTPSQRDEDKLAKILAYLEATDINLLDESIKEATSYPEVKEFLGLLKKSGIKNAAFDPTLMRGFDYYTDIVFEVFDTDPENNRSMFGGGRYDGLVGMFGVEPVPTVGFGMGDMTFYNFLESHKLLPKLGTETELYALIMTENYIKAFDAVNALREMGVNVAVDVEVNKKMANRIKTATKKGIANILFLGDKEIESEVYTLKNLDSSKQSEHSLQRIVSILKDHRNNA